MLIEITPLQYLTRKSITKKQESSINSTIKYSLCHSSFDFLCCSYLTGAMTNILLFTTSRRYLFLALFTKKNSCNLCCLRLIKSIVFYFTLFLVYYARACVIIPKLCLYSYQFSNIVLSYVHTKNYVALYMPKSSHVKCNNRTKILINFIVSWSSVLSEIDSLHIN